MVKGETILAVGAVGIGLYAAYKLSHGVGQIGDAAGSIAGDVAAPFDWLAHFFRGGQNGPSVPYSGGSGGGGLPMSPLPNPLTGSGGFSPLFGPIGAVAGSLPVPSSFPLFGPISAALDWLPSIGGLFSGLFSSNLSPASSDSAGLFSPLNYSPNVVPAAVAPTMLVTPVTNPQLYAPTPITSPAYNGGQFDLGGGVYGGFNNGNAYIDVPPVTNYSGGGSSSTWHSDPFNPGYGFFA